MNKKLVELRERAGSVALGRVLTLVIVTDDDGRPRGRHRGGQRRQPRAPVPRDRARRAASAGRPAARRADPGRRRRGRQRGHRAARLRPARRRGPGAWSCRCCCPTPRSWRGGRARRRRRRRGRRRQARAAADHRRAVGEEPDEGVRAAARDYAAGDTDLAWTRLTHWRALLAAALDVPPHDPSPGVVAGEAVSPSTDLMAGWLAAAARGEGEALAVASRRTGLVAVRLERPSGTVELVRPDGKIGKLPQPGQPDRLVALARREVSRLPGRGAAPPRPGRDLRGGAGRRAQDHPRGRPTAKADRGCDRPEGRGVHPDPRRTRYGRGRREPGSSPTLVDLQAPLLGGRGRAAGHASTSGRGVGIGRLLAAHGIAVLERYASPRRRRLGRGRVLLGRRAVPPARRPRAQRDAGARGAARPLPVDPARVHPMGADDGDRRAADADGRRGVRGAARRAGRPGRRRVPGFDVMLLGMGGEGHTRRCSRTPPRCTRPTRGGRGARLPEAAADARLADAAGDPRHRGVGSSPPATPRPGPSRWRSAARARWRSRSGARGSAAPGGCSTGPRRRRSTPCGAEACVRPVCRTERFTRFCCKRTCSRGCFYFTLHQKPLCVESTTRGGGKPMTTQGISLTGSRSAVLARRQRSCRSSAVRARQTRRR